MTFGAMAAWQAWALVAGVAALAAGLFLVKLRPPRMLLPSLLLWRRVLDEARTQTLWERIRRAVSLIVTIVIALALALAVTRPAPSGTGVNNEGGRLLVVMDSSWSMQARTGGGETRWNRAVAEARRLFSGAAGTEVALASTADGLVEGPTTDMALIDTALDRLQPGGGDGAAWPQLAGAGAAHFITDGATARGIDADVIVHSVFEPAPNVAITAFEVRPSLTPGHAGDAYLEVANFAPSAQPVRIRLTRASAPVMDRTFDMGAAEVLRQVIPIARGGQPSLAARIDAPQNSLAVDDEAFAFAERSQPLSVTVVGTQTQWLRTAVERDPDLRATFVQPADYAQVATGTLRADLIVFDRWAPAEAPRSPALLFAPPAAPRWLADAGAMAPGGPATAADERQPHWQAAGSHPVVLGVDPFTLTIERARAYPAAGLVPVALSARGTPLVYVKESPETRLVLVAFGVADSNLTSAPAFPVLLGNAIEWLARPDVFSVHGASSGAARGSRRPGLIAFNQLVSRVTGPGPNPIPLTRVDQTAFARVRLPGLYEAAGTHARSTFAVNFADPHLSNLLRTPSTPAGRARPVTAGGSLWPWWVYCAVAALVLAIAEWWTWQRRITV